MRKGFLLASAMLLSSNVFADICGKTDDRVWSNDPRIGKISKFGKPNGCTISLIGNNCALTAGNCSDVDVAQFNLPKSINGVTQEAKPEDQYEVENGQYHVDGVGTNWGVVKLRPNAITGKSAHEVQGAFQYDAMKAKKAMSIKVISYSIADNSTYPVQSGKVPPSPLADILNYSQQVAFGKILKTASGFKLARLDHDADTGTTSAGAAIVDMDSDALVGISTHGGCRQTDNVNAGTIIYNNKELEKAIKYCFQRK